MLKELLSQDAKMNPVVKGKRKDYSTRTEGGTFYYMLLVSIASGTPCNRSCGSALVPMWSNYQTPLAFMSKWSMSQENLLSQGWRGIKKRKKESQEQDTTHAVDFLYSYLSLEDIVTVLYIIVCINNIINQFRVCVMLLVWCFFLLNNFIVLSFFRPRWPWAQ